MFNKIEKKAKLVATESHRGQKRKTNGRAYIEHPTRVADMLKEYGASSDLVCAGFLHDVLEDTKTELNELQKIFNENTISIVLSHTENKELSWEERKQHTIDSMLTGSQDTVWLVIADKLDNLQDAIGYSDKDWSFFKRGKKEQYWYNKSILDNALTRKDIELPPYIKDFEKTIQTVFEKNDKEYILIGKKGR